MRRTSPADSQHPPAGSQGPAANARHPASDRFRSAFEHGLQPAWFADAELRFAEVNQALCRLLGRSAEELVGQSLLDLTPPSQRRLTESDVRALLAGERNSYQREQQLLHPEGTPVWALVVLHAVRDPSGGLRYVVGHASDVTEHRLREQRLRHLADHDPLTGLLNRRGFRRELRRHISRLKRYGAKGALLMLDLDNFKAYNDTNGHAAGDELLRSVGDVLNRRLRAGDVLGRLGGDEFAALLPEATPEQAEVVAAALVEAVREAGRQRKPGMSASIGVFSFEQGGDPTGETALVAADLAMYAAKHAGRDRHVADAPLDIVARMADDVGGYPEAGQPPARAEGDVQWPSAKRYQRRF